MSERESVSLSLLFMPAHLPGLSKWGRSSRSNTEDAEIGGSVLNVRAEQRRAMVIPDPVLKQIDGPHGRIVGELASVSNR
jgi:hypothetical protein